MTQFWNAALKASPFAAISGFIIYWIFPKLVEGSILDRLAGDQVFYLSIAIAVFTFVVAVLVLAPKSKPKSGNSVIVKDSPVTGDLVGGDKITNSDRAKDERK